MTAKFIVSSLAGMSVTGGSAGVGYWYSLPKDLKELLISENKKLLDPYTDKDNTKWQELATKYQGTDNSITLEGDQKVNKISDLQISIPTENQKASFIGLKSKCKELFEKKISDSENFKMAKRNAINWCTYDSVVLTKQIETNSTPQRNNIGPSPKALNSQSEGGDSQSLGT